MIRVLAGHVGEVRTVLRLGTGTDADDLVAARSQEFETASFSGLLPLVADFLHGERVDAAVLGVPGVVHEGTSAPGALPWIAQARELPALLGTERCALLNEAQAALHGLSLVAPERVFWLQRGQLDPAQPTALVEVGSAYGRAFGRAPDQVFATLAGQGAFAPRNAIERRLLGYLEERKACVTIEDVLSASGLRRLYAFLLHEGLAAPTALAEIERASHPAAEIARLGRRDLDKGCAAAIAFFADLLGSELGNVALQTLPRGGLYVTGTMVQELKSELERGELLDAFRDKGAASEVLETIPLALVDEPLLPILGAQRAAVALL
jgi:glucokinase